ncbi:hypothetical protein [Longibacter sp.]|uniref:hypothetical protein n=1 Tax=Longibacter sp. TaxID=2045415 RepID=UPI003EBB31E2
MPKSTSVTIELPAEHHDWLERVADRCNLSPGEVLQLQVLARANIAELSRGGSAALPRLNRPEMDQPQSDADDASVMDMLSSARDRLDAWEEKRQQISTENPRLDALRRRLESIRASSGTSDLGPQRQSGSSTTLIQQALARIQSVHTSESAAEEVSGDQVPTSMFEIAGDAP